MSNWKIIIPEATTNKVLNPSAETTGSYTEVGSGDIALSTTYSLYGHYSYLVTFPSSGAAVTFTLSALANAVHYITFRVRGTFPPEWAVGWGVSPNGVDPVLIEAVDANWNLYGVAFTAAQSSGITALYFYTKDNTVRSRYIDGIQVEQKSYWTTYCDGSLEGCIWNGVAHAASSSRMATSRAGGVVKDLQSDYYFDISSVTGTGYVPLSLSTDSYALLPGGQINAIKMAQRVFTFNGAIRGIGSLSDYHTKKQNLIRVLAHDSYPQDQYGWQPVRLIYTGAAIQKEISGFYEGGLEGDLNSNEPYFWERTAIRMRAPNPFFTEIGNSATALDSGDSGTYSYIAGRLASTGQWDDMGNGTNDYVRCIAVDADGRLYVGGDFTLAGGVANTVYIAMWDGTAWSALTTGLNVHASAIAIAADGSVYVGGLFTLAGGVANTAYIAKWSGPGGSWSALGTGMNGNVYALAIGLDGTLYAGGNFTLAGGIADTVRIAAWDGSAWTPLSTGADGAVNALAIGLDGTLYAGGEFANIGGVAANYVAAWNGTTWSALGSGTNDIIRALAVGVDGTLYAGGRFTTAGGVTVARIAAWNGASWSAMGSGIAGEVADLTVGGNGLLYIGWWMTWIDTPEVGFSIWNGSTYSAVDLGFSENVASGAVATYTNEQGTSVYLGFDVSATGVYGGLTTVTNGGNQPAYPIIGFKRVGGTAAVVTTVKNNLTGKQLLLNYALLDGETLTIDLTPTKKKVTSSFWGQRFDAILQNSDFGTFTLQPGDNSVTTFVTNDGATVTAWMEWQETYKSAD